MGGTEILEALIDIVSE
jgi:hypothetical protein